MFNCSFVYPTIFSFTQICVRWICKERQISLLIFCHISSGLCPATLLDYWISVVGKGQFLAKYVLDWVGTHLYSVCTNNPFPCDVPNSDWEIVTLPHQYVCVLRGSMRNHYIKMKNSAQSWKMIFFSYYITCHIQWYDGFEAKSLNC
jgi:hypothetical protein